MAKDILKYPGWMYAYGIASGQLSMKEARIEYMRIYHSLKERQRRLKQSEYAGSKFARKQLIPLSKIKSESQFIEEIQSLASMARSRMTSVTGIREYTHDVAAFLDVIGNMEGKSFKDFNHAQWHDFGEYMKRVHKAQYDSERAVKMFKIAKGAGMTGASLFRDYNYWQDHQKELQDYAAAGNPLGGRASSERIRDYISKH